MRRRRDTLILVLSLILTTLAIDRVRRLELKSDFRELLPSHTPSVQLLKEIETRLGPEGYLMIAAESGQWPALKRFIDDLDSTVRTNYPDRIQEVHKDKKALKAFFSTYKYLYIDLPDLEEIHRRLAERIAHEKLKVSGLFFDLEEEPPFKLEDIQSKYTRLVGRFQHYREGYFTNKEGTLAVLLLKPRGSTTAVELTERLMADLQQTIATLNPEKYAADMKVGFAGRFRSLVVEYRSVVGDIIKTSLLCITLVGLAVLTFFRNFRMGALMAANVIFGTLMALTLAYVAIGYLTSQSAFLGSILVGNGINYSLILMSRYLEERFDRQKTPHEAMRTSLRETWRPTLVAAVTASASFAVLGLTQIKGFSHFGLIGGSGMVICWLTTYICLPSWLLLSERIRPLKKREIKIGGWRRGRSLGQILEDRCRPILAVAVVAAVLLAWVTARYIPRSLEYDFTKLRFKAPETNDWESGLGSRTSEIFGRAITPSVIFAPTPDEAEAVCETILEKDREASEGWGGGGFPPRTSPAVDAVPARAAGDSHASTRLEATKRSGSEVSRGPRREPPPPPPLLIDRCQSLSAWVPKDQPAKLALLKKIRSILDPRYTKFLTPDQRDEMDRFLETRNLKPIAFDDLPEDLIEPFREKDGTLGNVVYVYPSPETNLWKGENLVRFANLIQTVRLPNGRVVQSSGEAVIFADLLKSVTTEGPRVTLYSLTAVILIVLLTFSRLKDSATVLVGLALGIVGMTGLMGIVGIKLNFLNFIALPTTFGIGVDYIVNMYQRWRQEKGMRARDLVARSGRAVFICSLTTIIGYSVLMTSRNQALVSFGLVAVLGEVTCLAVAVILLPAWIAFRTRTGPRI